MIDKMTVQTLTTKLDLNHITPKAAKEHLKKFCGLNVSGRTREDVIRAMNRELRGAQAANAAQGDMLAAQG